MADAAGSGAPTGAPTGAPVGDPAGAVAGPVPGAVRCPVERRRSGQVERVDDWIAEEVPVALEFNGVSHAVMLASPLDLEDFALGFALAEGIVDRPSQVYGVDVEPGPLGITLRLEVASEAFVRLKDRRRSLAGRTGCGLCGTESLEQVRRVGGGTAGDAVAVTSMPAIARAFAQFEARQSLQRATGAVHAAAWCAVDGTIGLLREDVGRHNALDKLIGALARQGVDASTGFFAVSSRASFEMVQKTAVAGVRLLAAVSAPTALAVETARCAGIVLVGFARRGDGVVYAGALDGVVQRPVASTPDGAPADERFGAVVALGSRRSVSPRRLAPPGPDRAELDQALRLALRAPDHAALRPWRVIQFSDAARPRLAELFVAEKRRRTPDADTEALARARQQALEPPLLLAFVGCPRASAEVPAHEQWLAAGAALGNLLNAFHLLGYGAIVLSGERCADTALAAALGIGADERLVGFVHAGTVSSPPKPPPEVPVDRVVTRWAG